MKAKAKLAAALLLAVPGCMMPLGCCVTRLEREQDGRVRVARYALLYPASADSVSVTAPNGETWQINRYNSDGGGSNAAAVVSAVAEGAVRGAMKGAL